MDTLTRSVSPSTDVQVKEDVSPLVQEKISAYYSLVFPHFTFYIQTLSITIGRRCAPSPHTATSSTAEPLQVDVDLGALKSVSRLHAKIEYDQDEDRFMLAVIGRNGAWVDGVWAASGTRPPLGERSQIQIASRIFQFVLPPPPPPEDSPSPSSHSSSAAARARSPSLDIETISPPSSQPSNSPPPIEHKLPSPPPEPPVKNDSPSHPRLPNSNSIGKAFKVVGGHVASTSNIKKRKKGDVGPSLVLERPKPEDMPPKPPCTYAQLIYRAIRAMSGKATLQEICTWISTTYDYYKYADGAWMSSVRHNLSSGRAFLKMERCGGDRGKGFFWSIDEKYAKALEEQEAKTLQAAANASTQGMSGGKDSTSKSGRKKDKGLPLPPPLTNTPLTLKTATSSAIVTPATSTSNSNSTSGNITGTSNASSASRNGITTTTPPTTGVFAYPSHPHSTHVFPISTITAGYAGTTNPYAALTQAHWGMHRPQEAIGTSNGTSHRTPSTSSITSTSPPLPPISASQVPQAIGQPPQAAAQSNLTSAQQQPIVPDVVIPIVLGPIPPTHPDYLPLHRNNSVKEGYMILHERKLILDPDVFSELTPDMLTELERMGARAALVVLTAHMVRALKERRAREREKGKERGSRRGRGSGRGTGRKGGTVTNSTNVAGTSKSSEHQGSPFTNVPLERRGIESAENVNVDEKASPSIQVAESSPTPVTEDGTILAADPASPIIVVDDSDDEGPAIKKRKVDDGRNDLQTSLDPDQSSTSVSMVH
ncbi:hypothetical protein AX17_001280 [Amanita inopinata Kibby_2008]|nr:hypothetical protein AX17_001280 [Amanita inopinata Kibby_2008]